MAILIIDDEEWNISKLEEVLREAGAETAYASSVDDAVTFLQEGSYNAVVTDFHLDTLNGKQLVSLIRGRFGDEFEYVDSFEEIEFLDVDLASYIKRNFSDFIEYKAFRDNHSLVPMVLFSSALYGDNDYDDPCLRDVFVEIKDNDNPRNYRAEERIRDYLVEKGVLEREF